MVVALEAYRIAYMALPKAGCTSVKEALARLDPAVTLPPGRDGDVTLWHDIYPTRRFRRHRWRLYTGWYRFCVLRDPLDRLLSLYTSRVQGFGDLEGSPGVRAADLPVQPDPDMFFLNLDRYRAVSSAIKHHALPAHVFLGRDLGAYSRVYRLEELESLAWDLSLLTRRPVEMPRGNSSQARLKLSDLRPETVDRLRADLAEEYEFVQGFYPDPFR